MVNCTNNPALGAPPSQISKNWLVIDDNNNNDNGFWPGSCYNLPAAVTIATAVSLVIFLIVVGNLLVIVSVILDQKLRDKRQNWLIVSLAAADFLVGLLVMPLTLAYELMNEWAMGIWLCELWLALDVLFVTSSILNLCMISIDRYWAITDPLRYPNKRTPIRMTAMIAACWLLSFIISFPPVVGWRPKRQEGQCILSTDIAYVLYSAFGSFYIPVMVLIIVYVRIYRITRKRAKKKLREIDNSLTQKSQNHLTPFIPNHPPQPPPYFARQVFGASGKLQIRTFSFRLPSIRRQCDSGSGGKQPKTDRFANHPLHQKLRNFHSTAAAGKSSAKSSFRSALTNTHNSAQLSQTQKNALRKRRLLKKQERRQTLVLGLIMLSFVACWMPFFVCYLFGAAQLNIPEIVFDVFFWLGYCNSALNPLIYTIFNPEFRRAFIKVLNLHYFLRR